MEPTGSRKRPRLGFADDLTNAREIHSDLVDCFEHLDVPGLGDPSRIETLRWPSLRSPEGIVGDYYVYVGRQRTPEIYQTITGLPRRSEIVFTGLPGSGKTVIAATIAGYLLVHPAGNRRVVYILGRQYVIDPVDVLKEALLLAYIGDISTAEMLLKISTMEELVKFCQRAKPQDLLVFVLDEWNQLDPVRSEHVVAPNASENRAHLLKASHFHVLVKVCSPRSEDALQYHASDKRLPRIVLNDPLTEEELKSWVSATEFGGLQPNSLMELYTGYRPRLLNFYAKSTCLADLDDYLEHYVDSVSTFVNGLSDPFQLEIAMRMAVGSPLSPLERGCVQWDWSYLVRISPTAVRIRLASDHLSTFLADAILQRTGSLGLSNHWRQRKIWAAAVERDSNKATAANSPRVGWNVEALIISTVKTTKRLLNLTFGKWKHYDHDGELEAMQDATLEELLNGILFVPLRYNETAVDLVVVKLVKTEGGGDELVVHGFQISVSTLKRKLAKDSHTRWEKEVLPKWKAAFPQVTCKVDYTYILPESCPEDYQKGVHIARFGQVDEVLAFVDRLKLPDPSSCEVEPLVVCSGLRHRFRAIPARLMHAKRTTDTPYFCCDAHKEEVWKGNLLLSESARVLSFLLFNADE